MTGLAPGLHQFRVQLPEGEGLEIEVFIVGVRAQPQLELYPNPFSTETALKLAIAKRENVRISAYDLLGRQVRVLYDGSIAAGSVHRFVFDGAGLPAGIYVLRVDGESFQEVLKVILVR